MRSDFLVVLVLVAGCGPNTEDVLALTSAATELQNLMTTHTGLATRPVESCSDRLNAYEAQTGALVVTLERVCPGLDHALENGGHRGSALLMHTVGEIKVELGQHVKAHDCGAASLTSELQRHHDYMWPRTLFLQAKSSELNSMMAPAPGDRPIQMCD